MHLPLSNDVSIGGRADVRAMFDRLWAPVRDAINLDGPALLLGAQIGAHGTTVSSLECFARPLWGVGPAGAGGYCACAWDAIAAAMERGFDPQDPSYWGSAGNFDQRFVEFCPMAVAIQLHPEELWRSRSDRFRKLVGTGLSQINNFDLYDNNWLFFRVLINTALFNVAGIDNREIVGNDLDRIDSFYLGQGWYSDGETSRCDYYGPMALHYYGLLYSAFAGAWDAKRAEIFTGRAREFAPQFAAWFEESGAAIPFGRSLVYRFAQGAFWGALAFAGIEGIPWGCMRRIYLSHLEWWSKTEMMTDSSMLSVGYCYPNSAMGEAYNSCGSPYWAFKTFLPLALPESHPFWASPSADFPRRAVHVQAKASMVVCRDHLHDHVFALSAKPANAKVRHVAEKYSKFAYSSTFAFSTPLGSPNPSAGFGDSTLLLTSDGVAWRSRSVSQPPQFEGDVIRSRWKVFEDVEVVSWLKPLDGGHLRVHAVRSRRPLKSFEGGFDVDRGATGFRESISAGRSECSSSIHYSSLACLSALRTPVVMRTEPQTNIAFKLAAFPGLHGVHSPGVFWLTTACLGFRVSEKGATAEGSNYFARFAVVQSDGALEIYFGGGAVLRCAISELK